MQISTLGLPIYRFTVAVTDALDEQHAAAQVGAVLGSDSFLGDWRLGQVYLADGGIYLVDLIAPEEPSIDRP